MSKAILPDIAGNIKTSMIALLNARLADALDLKLAVKQAHWNVKGPSFIAVHELLDEVASHVDDHSDTIAERAVQLGGVAKGTAEVIVKETTLKPYPLDLSDQNDHLAAVRDRMQSFNAGCRKGITESDDAGDMVTADMLTKVAGDVDKYIWFIASHLPQ